MKVILLIVVLAIFGYFSQFVFAYRSSVRACNEANQGSLDTIMAQSQTVLADHYEGCNASYEVVTSWDMCLGRADATVPERWASFIKPLTMNMMMFFREQKKDIKVIKIEHDERCKGYTELMFFPPDAEL